MNTKLATLEMPFVPLFSSTLCADSLIESASAAFLLFVTSAPVAIIGWFVAG